MRDIQLNAPMRLAMSTSSLRNTMDAQLLHEAFMVQANGPVVPVSDKMNTQMCDFLREVALVVNDSVITALELYFSPTLDRRAMAEVVHSNLRKEVWSVHGPYGLYLDLSSPDPIAKDCAFEGYKEAILFAADLSAKVVVVHPGFAAVHDVPREVRLQCSIEGIKRVADFAAQHNIIPAVEFLPTNEIGSNMEDMAIILDKVDRQNVGITFDTNHLFPAEQIPAYIRELDGKIKNVHTSDQDNIDRHWLPFKGNLDWEKVLGALAAGGYTGPLVYETHLREATTVEDAVRKICDNYSELSKLIPPAKG